MQFSEGFVWGVATASYQIEGAAFEDGKGLSVWDMLCRKPGAIWNDHNGDCACDHYHHLREDVALMKSLGIQAYRFSLSWPRILPGGTGPVNQAGLDFYDRLVDELSGADITPYITLFHWDYPNDLYCQGGWLNPASPDWFADYTQIAVHRLGDRVGHWLTLNEPQCFVILGHADGIHAPGDKLGQAQVLRIAHNTLLAHGKSVQAIRAASPIPCQVGLAPAASIPCPTSNALADIEAARSALFDIRAPMLWSLAWWLDPIFLGHYPEDGLVQFGNNAPQVRPGDMETICQPLDLIGINIYQGPAYRAGPNGQPENVAPRTGYPHTANGWAVPPEALYWGPRFLYERYHLPVYIFENGMSGIDWVSTDGKVHDPQRIDYTRRYLQALLHAASDGIPIRGYFHWSLMDNFEWAEGYKERFGLVHVDFNSLARTPKDSAFWYQQIIATNGESLDNPT
jgi:beta-glucosidase